MNLLVFKNSVLCSLPRTNRLVMTSNRLPDPTKRLDLHTNCLAATVVKTFKIVYKLTYFTKQLQRTTLLIKRKQSIGLASNRLLPSDCSFKQSIAFNRLPTRVINWILLIPESHIFVSTIKTIVQILFCDCNFQN